MIKSLVAAAAMLALGTVSATAGPGDDPSSSVKAETVAAAIAQLGYATSMHKDAKGDPHIVVTDKPGNVAKMAVFFADCGSWGCEDLTFYAGYTPTKKATTAKMNEWNHITSNLRSRASISGDGDKPSGEPGIAMTVSLMTDADADKLAILAGVFVVESQMFADTLAK
ncbi:MAG: hypothetical protein O3B37_12040 [Proteobacteria bacterium]|nr:hypothetical protein [Pseudomonadota bacterium]